MQGFVYLAQDKHGLPLIWSTIHATAQEAVDADGDLLPDLGWQLHYIEPVPADEIPECVFDPED